MQAVQIADLVDSHGTAVYRFCHQLTHNKMDADDLYQETFLKALEQCQKIDEEKNPQAFLLSLTVRLWKSNRRKYARRARLAPTVEFQEELAGATDQNLEEHVISRAVCQAVRQVVEGLDDKYRLPVYLYYTLELNMEEIAAALHIPPGTVKSRLHHARALMKKRLEAGSYETRQFGGATL